MSTTPMRTTILQSYCSSMSGCRPVQSPRLERGVYWRRGQDLNLREPFGSYSLSKRAPSATRPPLREVSGLLLEPSDYQLAEREGFEPPVPAKAHRFSKPAH